MPFAKLKKWFRRRRNDGRFKEDQRVPAAPETQMPVARALVGAVTAKPSAAPTAARKKALAKKRKRGKPSVSGPLSTKAVASRPLSRQGIPILKPDEDLKTHFRDAAVDETYRDPSSGHDAGVSDQRKAAASSASGPATAPRRRNRAGIRLLDGDTDLHDYFMSDPNDAPTDKKPGLEPKASTRPRAQNARVDFPIDRHGIPRLDDQTDLQQLFDTANDEAENAEDLGEALYRTLDHDAHGLMQQKTGGFFPPRRLSLKEKLRRYPAPQAQSDLHGATAAKACQRADAFIRTARNDGLFTVRIIVGKGLHSEGGAVLPDVIEDLLVTLKREDVVLSYRWDKRIKRKSGAIIVYLTTGF